MASDFYTCFNYVNKTMDLYLTGWPVTSAFASRLHFVHVPNAGCFVLVTVAARMEQTEDSLTHTNHSSNHPSSECLDSLVFSLSSLKPSLNLVFLFGSLIQIMLYALFFSIIYQHFHSIMDSFF